MFWEQILDRLHKPSRTVESTQYCFMRPLGTRRIACGEHETSNHRVSAFSEFDRGLTLF